jgi:hypothetical protein
MRRSRRGAQATSRAANRSVRLVEVAGVAPQLPVLRLGPRLTAVVGIDAETADRAAEILAAVVAGERVERADAVFDVGGRRVRARELARSLRDDPVVVDVERVEARRRARDEAILAELEARRSELARRLDEHITAREGLAAQLEQLRAEAGPDPAPVEQLEADVARARAHLAEVDASAGRLTDAVVARIELLHAEVEAAERALETARRADRAQREHELSVARERERDALARVGLPSRAAFLLALVERAPDVGEDAARGAAAAALDAALAALDAARTREAARAILLRRAGDVGVRLSAADRDVESLRAALAEVEDTARAHADRADLSDAVTDLLRGRGERLTTAVVRPALFRGRAPDACTALLERLRDEAAGGQIVVVSEVPAVAAWAARADAVTVWTPDDARRAAAPRPPAAGTAPAAPATARPAEVFAAPAGPPPAAPGHAAVRMCLRHRNLPATAQCDRCREMFCDQCLLPVREALLCIDCALVAARPPGGRR